MNQDLQEVLRANPLPASLDLGLDLPTFLVVLLGYLLGHLLTLGPIDKILRLYSTLIHELGHVLLSGVMGMRLKSVKVRIDASGITESTTSSSWRNIPSLLSGYPAPGALGVLLAFLLWDHITLALLLYSLLALLLLLLSRSLLTIALSLTLSALLLSLLLYAPLSLQVLFLSLLAALFTIGGLRVAISLQSVSSPESDPGQLRRLTRLPQRLFARYFLFLSFCTLFLLPVPLLLPYL